MKEGNLSEKLKNSVEEKNTILVWLDFGPYPYFHLGVISELSKLGKFDFIGIITTEQDLDFFQKQKFVQFKKLLYYPECYIGKSTFDINNLKKIEDDYELKLWKDIFSERSFYKFWTYFHKFSYEEILIIIENSLLFFKNIINEYQPKMILMQQAGENVSNLLLYRLAKKMKIEISMPVDMHYKDHIHISNNLTSDEISNEFENTKGSFDDSLEEIKKDFLKKKKYTDILKTISSYDSGIKTFSQKIKHYIRRLSNNLEPTYINVGKTRYKMIKNRWQNYFELKKRQRFLDNNTKTEIRNEKFLYFPLQSEPEAAILANTPFYSNQIALIEVIAKSIPINYTLYVKEHPLQKIKLWRSVRDYKKIIDIPNVRFLHPSVNAQKIIEKSQGVISISGATGFETLFYRKPVILFGNDHYDKLSMVTKVETLNNLPQNIRNALFDFKFNEKEFSIYIKILKKHALYVPYYSILKQGVLISSIQRNGREFELTNEYFQKFYDEYKQYFKLLANTIFLKI